MGLWGKFHNDQTMCLAGDYQNNHVTQSKRMTAAK